MHLREKASPLEFLPAAHCIGCAVVPHTPSGFFIFSALDPPSKGVDCITLSGSHWTRKRRADEKAQTLPFTADMHSSAAFDQPFCLSGVCL